ncbi:TIMELESS-interacting protein isoform X1 [Oreochromis niloticus]|uniref:TIMELESS-interacting protein isoform X1 n=1 Tax=Oreochromis niloticus TaxID=8128 RepID=UPI000393D1CF|nr:TIMELESS-interacting protein isoform X1 [Oreochromis niloticus]
MLDQQENSPHDIPDYDGIEDEAFPPLPPPHSPGRGAQEEGDPFADGDEGEVSQLADVPTAKRRGVKRPQPKLDSHRWRKFPDWKLSERWRHPWMCVRKMDALVMPHMKSRAGAAGLQATWLISDRGLPALGTLFDNVQFKGKGHEAADLRLLMQKMENWAHRLYPKLQFEDFIDKVERLGSKKEVQTCLKRIRLDMPLTHEDFTSTDGAGDEEVQRELETFGDPDLFSRESFVNGPQGQIAEVLAPPPTPSLTEEQQKRIELNRQRALEKRLARQQQQQIDSQTADMLGDKPPAASSPNVINSSTGGDETVEDPDLEPTNNTSTQQTSPLPPKDSEPAEEETGLNPEQQLSNDCKGGD